MHLPQLFPALRTKPRNLNANSLVIDKILGLNREILLAVLTAFSFWRHVFTINYNL
jgi:hypothetical protein